MMLSAILFDLDGTLTHTDSIHYAVWQDILRPHNVDLNRKYYDAMFSGRLNVDIIRDVLPQLGPKESKGLSDRKEAQFRERAANELVPLDGLLDLLYWTKEQGIARGIVTNAPEHNANFMIDALKLRPWFSTIVIGECLSHGKPHPLPYITGLERLGVSASQTVVFEDSPSGIRSAIGAGIPTIGITSTHTSDALRAVGAHHTIVNFADADLKSILGQLRARAV